MNRSKLGIAVVALVAFVVASGFITKVRDWKIEDSELVSPSFTTAGHSMKVRTMALGDVSATAITIDAPGAAMAGVGLAGGAALGSTEGYVTMDADADSLCFTVQLPETMRLNGTAADLIFQFDISEGVDTSASWSVKAYPYGAVSDTYALVSDSFTVANGTARGWVGLNTLAYGIGAVSGLDVGDRLYFVLSPLSDEDTATVYGVRVKYRAGVQATE